jgi:FKBP-type peptidyl-prolyl cis-trans isomerase FkpA
MTSFVRGLAALLCAAAMAATPALQAQDRTSLDTERDRTSYMIGMDVGRSLVAVGPDLDLAAFERAVRHAFGGGEPLLSEADAADVICFPVPPSAATPDRPPRRTVTSAIATRACVRPG